MSYEVTLQPSGNRFSVPKGRTILQAALDSRVALPYSCRAGCCRTCKGRVVEGQVDFGHTHPRYLSDAERLQGLALLCQATPLSNLRIEIQELDILSSIRRRQTPGRVMEMRLAAVDVMVLRIKLPMNEDLKFLAGQYVEFLLADGERRAYSIASAPSMEGTASIELHVRHTPGGRFTDHVFKRMKVHDLVRLEAPLGTFFLRSDSSKPIVFVASGTGFAPIKSILQDAASKCGARPITMYWGGRSRADLYDLDWLQAYAKENAEFKFVPVLSEPTAACSWRGRRGFVHLAVIEDFPDLSGHQVYACGAPVMIEAAKRDFVNRCRLPAAEFFADSFLDSGDRARGRA